MSDKIKIYCVIDSSEFIENYKIKFRWTVGIWTSLASYNDKMKDHYRKGIWLFNTEEKPTEESFNKEFIKEIKDRFISQTPHEFKHTLISYDDYKLHFIFNNTTEIENKISLNKMYEKINLNVNIDDNRLSETLMPIAFLPRIQDLNYDNKIQDILISTNEGLKIIDKYLFIENYKEKI